MTSLTVMYVTIGNKERFSEKFINAYSFLQLLGI